MAQKLFIKTTDEEGRSSLRPVTVIRSWQVASGAQIFLHTSGIYGYKDESPIKSRDELEIIGDARQRQIAEAWWDRTGRDYSEKYYRRLEAELAARQDADIFPHDDAGTFDAVQYVRRPIADRRKNAWSEPTTWFEWFKSRPEWWGMAGLIEIGNHRYKRVEGTEVEIEPEPDEIEESKAEEGTVEPGLQVGQSQEATRTF